MADYDTLARQGDQYPIGGLGNVGASGSIPDLNTLAKMSASVERVTFGHYADQLSAGISQLHSLLDKIDGGVPTPDQAEAKSGLGNDFQRSIRDLQGATMRLSEIAARLGRIL